jgi:hypothetical protein
MKDALAFHAALFEFGWAMQIALLAPRALEKVTVKVPVPVDPALVTLIAGVLKLSV